MSREYYSIYAVEHKTKTNESHSFLMKVREGRPHGCILDLPPDVDFGTEELHFTDDTYGLLLTAYSRSGKRRNHETYVFQGYISGDQDYIEGLWEKALQLCPAVRCREILFDVDAPLQCQFNCRSGTEAALNAMNLKFLVDDECVPKAGLGKDLLSHLRVA